mmetsp:Transcript_108954/g.351773  ORF Transcript_108954/g.351773 Transcript_108954/m.351773 type:complete len:466 (-) Transcript_108954:4-1401(-)
MAKVAPFESAELKVKEAGKATASGRRGSAVSLHSEQPHERHRVSGLALARYYARNVLHRSGWYDSTLATSIRKILRGRVFVGVTMVCLVIALFLGELFAIFQVPTNTALDIVLTAVFAVFLLEFLMRLAAWKTFFFRVPEWQWHAFDTFLIILSIVEFVLGVVLNAITSNVVMVMRVARIVRLVRLVRIVRLIGAFRELRLMVYGMLKSAQSLFWSITFLVIVIYFFAICFEQAVISKLDSSPPPDERLRRDLLEWFGSLQMTMSSLFMALSGGCDWADLVAPLKEISWAYYLLFLVYLTVTVYGALNIMTATFVESAVQTAKLDRDLVIQDEMARKDSYMALLRNMFTEADTDGSGTLSWEEFSSHLQDNRILAYFAALELDISEARGLFRLLDTDESNMVNIDEFVLGCFRLKGQAKGIDMQTLMYENKKMMEAWLKFMCFCEEEFSLLYREVSNLRRAPPGR